MVVVDERVSVNLLNSQPTGFVWRNRRYAVTQVGLHHTLRQGRTLMHVFSVTDGSTCFTLQFDTESLKWKLCSIQDQ